MYFVIVAFFTLILLFHNTSPISLRDIDSIQRSLLFNNHPLNFPGKKLIIKRSGPNFESVQVISSSSSIIPNSLNKEEPPSLFDSNAFPLSPFTKAIDEIENNFIRKATLMDKLIYNPNEQKIEVKSLSNINSKKVNINHNNSNNNNNISKVMSHKMTERFMKNESDIQVNNNTENNLNKEQYSFFRYNKFIYIISLSIFICAILVYIILKVRNNNYDIKSNDSIQHFSINNNEDEIKKLKFNKYK